MFLMKVPKNFEFYNQDELLLLILITIYGLKQAARAFLR